MTDTKPAVPAPSQSAIIPAKAPAKAPVLVQKATDTLPNKMSGVVSAPLTKTPATKSALSLPTGPSVASNPTKSTNPKEEIKRAPKPASTIPTTGVESTAVSPKPIMGTTPLSGSAKSPAGAIKPLGPIAKSPNIGSGSVDGTTKPLTVKNSPVKATGLSGALLDKAPSSNSPVANKKNISDVVPKPASKDYAAPVVKALGQVTMVAEAGGVALAALEKLFGTNTE